MLAQDVPALDRRGMDTATDSAIKGQTTAKLLCVLTNVRVVLTDARLTSDCSKNGSLLLVARAAEMLKTDGVPEERFLRALVAKNSNGFSGCLFRLQGPIRYSNCTSKG